MSNVRLKTACERLIALNKEDTINDECSNDGDGHFDTYQSDDLEEVLAEIESALAGS